MRLFVAINFSPEIKTRLLILRDELKVHSARGNFSLRENLHLTLAFLGECGEKEINAAKSALEALVFEPFTLQIGCTGRFRRDGGDIWWAGIHKNQKLSALHRDLTHKLHEAGFALETRNFSPHITLGREVVTREDFSFGKFETIVAKVYSIELMKSERIGGKLTYTAIMKKNATKVDTDHDH